ncbi:hypothetical protein [Absidia glauca]|uniref:dolichyl-phosphate beta-glucosyltransferase n=1 Tax=Absidia glauca TaxID=4829 RepID=A0A163IYS8_ABSGL|nr:hypothetical protein [Absidia glauca]
MTLLLLLLGGIVIGIVLVLCFLLISSPSPRKPTENEGYYNVLQTEDRQKTPSIFDPPSVSLSLIVPAFDESKRLPIMLNDTVDFLETRKKTNGSFTYEVIIVDDGSRDNTIQAATDYARNRPTVDIRILALEKNRGKGGAVTQGMLCARGEQCLMVDADGATEFSDLANLEEKLESTVNEEGYGIAVGSRSHLVSTEAVVKRSFIRNFLMRAFHTLVYTLGIRGIEDTQCGFKLFTRKAAQLVFPNMHVERWIFDIECLMIAQSQKIPLVEVQVKWHEIDGSKVNLITDSAQMARDLFLIRLNFMLGFWKIHCRIAGCAPSDQYVWSSVV